jgi:DNA-directed RNA polymerase II subunit RPB2
MEDSVVINGDAVERGFFNTIFFRTYKDEEEKHKSATTASEQFTRPDKSLIRVVKHGSSAINSKGVPQIGKKVKGGDVIIGKVIKSKESDEAGYMFKDVSTVVRKNESGTVDKVIPDGKITNTNADGHKFIMARMSALRKPEIGDKFASRHAQKGTGGMLYSMVDLPFSCLGLCPDIIMNPHGIPSRMTVGKLLETFLGRVGVAKAQFQDATPFTTPKLDDHSATLKKYGVHEFGNEVMYNGQNGGMFKAQFYYGPTYYQRLKHMVKDKIHSRESGPVQLLTRQPAEGRTRDGGLRLGEMERDVLIAHGIPQFLKERMMDSSDIFRVFVSKKDEAIVVGNPQKQIFRFNNEDIRDDEICEVQMPYAMKLLLQEMESMGIDVRLNVG